jgi:hypothetical protein
MNKLFAIEDIVTIQGVIMNLQATLQQPSPNDPAYLRAAASELLKIATGRTLAEIEGESFRAGMNGKQQPNFDPLKK